MNYGDDRQVVAGVLRPTRELFRLFQKQADEASVWRLGRELDGLERELLAAYQRRDVVEAQAIRRELGSLKATLVERIEEEESASRKAKAWTTLMDVPVRS
jgi:hypothetical protein